MNNKSLFALVSCSAVALAILSTRSDGQQPPAKTLQVKAIEIVNNTGRVVLRLSTGEDGQGAIQVKDQFGQDVLIFGSVALPNSARNDLVGTTHGTIVSRQGVILRGSPSEYKQVLVFGGSSNKVSQVVGVPESVVIKAP